jgi:hypothetical protein
MLPGLGSEPAGSVTVSQASLVLRSGQVEVTLTVSVPRGLGGSVSIQMPRFGWLGDGETYPDRQFPELQIVAGGVPATMESSFAAFVGSADVSEALRSAGIDPFAIAQTPPFVTAKTGGAPALVALERLGAVEKYEGEYLAKWTAQRKVKLALKPGPDTLKLTYKPRPGYGLLRFDQITRPAYLAKYCLSAPALESIFGHSAANRMFVVLEYAIPSSIDDKPPLSLSIAADALGKEEMKRSVVAFCGTDGKAVIGQATNVKTSARTDAKGIVRILSIGTPIGSK